MEGRKLEPQGPFLHVRLDRDRDDMCVYIDDK